LVHWSNLQKSPDRKRSGLFRLAENEIQDLVDAQFMTSSVTVVVWVTPPPVAVMVMVRFPSLAFLPARTVMVEVPEPGAAIELGLKVTPFDPPCPEADREIAELKPPETAVVIFVVPELPRATLIVAGEALTVKFGLVPVTVSVTVVVSTVLPEVPVTEMW